jgi:enoyl-CoA hydratase
MPWELEARGHAVIVHLRSNRANRMNPALFADCEAAFATLDAEHPDRPVVLTGEGATFSAGLDLDDVLGRFRAGDPGEIAHFFERFRAMILRVFLSPRRTVAAVNGHAYAGGLILALACDARVLARGPARFSLIEVPIGIAIPSSYVEVVRHALGDRVTAEAALEGRLYDVDEAVAAGIGRRAVDPAELLTEAVTLAEVVPPDAAAVYAATKKAVRAPVAAQLEGPCRTLDHEAFRALALPASTRLQAAALARLKNRPKTR